MRGDSYRPRVLVNRKEITKDNMLYIPGDDDNAGPGVYSAKVKKLDVSFGKNLIDIAVVNAVGLTSRMIYSIDIGDEDQLRTTGEDLFIVRYIVYPHVKKSLPRGILTEEEMGKILRHVREEDMQIRAIIELFYATGIRRMELINLDLYDIDLRERTLCVREGKGGIRYIQAMLGHECLSTTAIYTHLDNSDIKRELDLRHPRSRMRV